MSERIGEWEVEGTEARDNHARVRLGGDVLTVDTNAKDRSWAVETVDVPLPVLVALLRARGFGVVEPGAEGPWLRIISDADGDRYYTSPDGMTWSGAKP